MALAIATASRLKPEVRLGQAISVFVADLSDEQKTRFNAKRSQALAAAPSVQDVRTFTAEIDRSHGGRCLGPRFINLIEAVQKFASLGDILIGGSQNIVACGVWSAVRLSLSMITSSFSQLEKISLIFMDIGRSAPRFESMALLYPHSHELQSCVCEYFIVVVNLCHDILKFKKQPPLGKFGSSLSDSFNKYASDLQSWGTSIKDEVQLQMTKRANEEAEKNSYFRKVSTHFFKSSSEQHIIQARQQVFDFCCRYDYMVSWKQIRKAGNTNVFCSCPYYKAWRSRTDCEILVYTGKLGAGKSVMLANMVDDLYLHFNGLRQVGIVAFFFARHDVSETLKARTIIGSIVQQILSQLPNLTPAAEILEAHSREDDFEQMLKMLGSVLTPDFKPFVLLDGIDELMFDEREILLHQIYSLQQSFHMSFCISIRQQSRLQLEIDPQQFANVNLEIVPMPENITEIEAFVSEELEKRVKLRTLAVGSPLLLLEVQEALVKGSQGMFLWVALQIESLCAMRTDGEIREALHDLPKDLSETFTRILQRSDIRGKYPYQKWILELITVAQHQLTLEEMREALSVIPGEKEWNKSRRVNDIHSTLSLCGSLIIIDEEDFTLRLVHHSVKQFLVDNVSGDGPGALVDPIAAHRRMSDIIITYLHFPSFDTQLTTGAIPELKASSAMSGIIRSTGYSLDDMSSLALKVRKGKSSPSNFNLGKTLAEARSPCVAWRKEALFLQSYAKKFWYSHVSWSLPLSPQIEIFFQRLYKRNAFDPIPAPKDVQFLLCRAMEAGLVDFAQYLIDFYDIDVNSGLDADGNTALHLAIIHDLDDMVKFFLAIEGLNVKVVNNENEAAMQLASRKSKLTTIKAFLDAGKVDHRASVLSPVICRAAKEGDEPLVERLIHYSERKSTHSATVWRAIDAAVGGAKPRMVKLLLDFKTTPTFEPGVQGFNPLYTAVREGNEQIVNIILQSGKLDPRYHARRVLFLSAQRRQAVICRMLSESLSKWKDVDRADQMSTENKMTVPPGAFAPYNKQPVEAPDNSRSMTDELRNHLRLTEEYRGRNPSQSYKSPYSHRSKSKSVDVDGNTSLHLVSQAGYDELVTLLLDDPNFSHVDLNVANDKGNTPLHLAAAEGHFGIVRYLINTPNVYLSTNNYGNTALHLAAMAGHSIVVEILTGIPAIVLNAINRDGNTALHLAAKAGYFDTAKQLASMPTANLYALNMNDDTPLLVAALAGHSSIASMLIDLLWEGRIINEKVFATALVPSREFYKHATMVKSLSGCFTPPFHENNWNGKFLEPKSDGHDISIKSRLKSGWLDQFCTIKECGKQSPLHLAALVGSEEATKALLLHGADPFSLDENEYTPLDYASEMCHESIVEILTQSFLFKFGSLHAKRGPKEYGSKALDIAIASGEATMIARLLGLPVSSNLVQARMWSGQTALHIAAERNHKSLLEFLISKRPEINAKSIEGQTPLHLSALHGNIFAARCLLANGAIPSVQDGRGLTPLHYAARSGSREMAELLILYDKGLLSVHDNSSRSPLHVAAINGRVDTFFCLLGTDFSLLNDKDERGLTALDHAIDNGHELLVEFMSPRTTSESVDWRYLLNKLQTVDQTHQGEKA